MGALHWQLTIVTPGQAQQGMTEPEIRQAFGWPADPRDARVYLRPMYGAFEQSEEYCEKEDTRVAGTGVRVGLRPGMGVQQRHARQMRGGGGGVDDMEVIEVGRKPKPNAPNEWKEAVALAESGVSMKQMILAYPRISIQFWNGINRVKEHMEPPAPIRDEVVCWLYWGPTGTGKTHRACTQDNLDPREWVIIPTGSKWFPGYVGQKRIILDEFGGSFGYQRDLDNINYFKTVTDKYPLKVEVKGGHADAKWTEVIVTSQLPLSAWWPDYRRSKPDEWQVHIAAIERRMNNGKNIIFVGKKEDTPFYTDTRIATSSLEQLCEQTKFQPKVKEEK